MAVAALLGSAGLLIVDGFRVGDNSTKVTTWSLSLVLLSVVALVVAGQREGHGLGFDSMRIGAWFPVWFGFGFGLMSLSWRQPNQALNAVIDQSDVVTALMLLHVAIAAWTSGYLVGPGSLLTKAGSKLASSLAPGDAYVVRHARVAWVLFGIGLAGRILQLLSGRFGYLGDPSQLLTNPARSGQLIAVLIQCGTIAIVVAAVDYVRNPSANRRTTLLVILGSHVVLTSLSGHNGQFLVALMAVAIVFAAAGRFPWRSMLAGFAVFVVLVVPYVTSLRETVRTDATTLSVEQGLATAPDVLQTSLGQPYSERLLGSFEKLGARTRGIDMIAVVVATTPGANSFESPVEYLQAPVFGLVPRAVWPSKPVLDSGYQFARKLLGTRPGQYTSAAIPPAADLYLHGGLVVVVVGMFGLGTISRLVDRTLHPQLDLRYAIVFLLLFQTLIKSESDVSSILASLPLHLVVAFVVGRYAFRAIGQDTPAPGQGETPRQRLKTDLTNASQESHAIAAAPSAASTTAR